MQRHKNWHFAAYSAVDVIVRSRSMSEQKQKRELSASYWKSYLSDRTIFLEFAALFPEAFEVTEQGRSQKKKFSCLHLTKKAGKKLNFSLIATCLNI